VTTTPESLPDDIAALRAALIAAHEKFLAEAARAARIEAELAVAKAKASDDQAVIAHQQLQIAKLSRQLYGQRSERMVRLLAQMELALEELESSATEDAIAAERAVGPCCTDGACRRGDANPVWGYETGHSSGVRVQASGSRQQQRWRLPWPRSD
jgi:hypothetical protein